MHLFLLYEVGSSLPGQQMFDFAALSGKVSTLGASERTELSKNL